MAKSEAALRIEELKKKMKANVPKLSEVKKSNQDDDDSLGYKGFSDFLEFEDGKTIKLRFFPPHTSHKNFFFMRKRYWLPREDDQGNIGKTTVLDSIKHGGTKLDIVDEYRKIANKILKGDEKQLKKINDTYGGGIAPSIDWVAYALKVAGEKRDFGLIAFKKTVRDEINKINFIEEDDEPVETVDTFTGEGYPLLVKYLSKPNKKKSEDYYSCSKGKKPVELEDEEILKWGDAKPLSEIYDNVYTLIDFEKALECLRLFDETEDIGVFDDDRWEDIVEQVKEQYDEQEEEEDEDEKPVKKSSKKPVKKSSKKVVDEDDDEDEDDEDEEEEKPKKSSKKPSKKVVDEDDEDEDDEDEDEDDEEEVPVKKSSKKPSKKVVEEDDEDEDDEDEDDEDEDDEDEDEKPAKKSSKGKLSIDEIRARLKGKK
jgi:hypothetical protein